LPSVSPAAPSIIQLEKLPQLQWLIGDRLNVEEPYHYVEDDEQSGPKRNTASLSEILQKNLTERGFITLNLTANAERSDPGGKKRKPSSWQLARG
jgi:hypothetical protein